MTRFVGSHQLTELFLAGPQSLPLPPGVSRLPDPGEAYVSPRLASEIADHALARSTLPFRPVGLVGPQGLISPDELYAVVGSRQADLPGGGHSLGGYGIRGSPEVDIGASDLTLIEFAFLALVGIPLAVFFSVTARLSAATRDRRLATLRLLGMSQAQTRRVSAVETIVAAILGALLGLGVYALIQGWLASSHLGSLVWYKSDAGVSVGRAALCLIGVPVLAGILGISGSRNAVRNALAVRRQAEVRKFKPTRLITLGVGLGVLLGLLLAAATSPTGSGLKSPAPLIMLGAIITTGIGLALGFPVLAASIAVFLASRARQLWLQLGMRRLSYEPSSATRVVSGLIIVVFGMGFATGLQRDARAAAAPLGRYEHFGLTASEIPTHARRSILALPEVKASDVVVASIVTGPGQPAIAVGFTSCADLADPA